jgi:hypothetical protein
MRLEFECVFPIQQFTEPRQLHQIGCFKFASRLLSSSSILHAHCSSSCQANNYFTSYSSYYTTACSINLEKLTLLAAT